MDGGKMKRNKKWWAALTKDERAELIWLEKSTHSTSSAYLPDDCSTCNGCGNPQLGSGLCQNCANRLDELINKAEEMMGQ
jgi:hypothetical protein